MATTRRAKSNLEFLLVRVAVKGERGLSPLMAGNDAKIVLPNAENDAIFIGGYALNDAY